jgi:hypothetical protein
MSAVSGDFHAAAIARPRVQVGGNDNNAVHEYLRDIMPRHGLARRQSVSAPQHDALDALCVGITAKCVHFYFDADVRSFSTISASVVAEEAAKHPDKSIEVWATDGVTCPLVATPLRRPNCVAGHIGLELRGAKRKFISLTSRGSSDSD